MIKTSLLLSLSLVLLAGCGTNNGATQPDPSRNAAAPAKKQIPQQAEDPAEAARYAAQTFLQIYVGAIVHARGHARRVKGPIRIEVDQDAHQVLIIEDTTDKQIKALPYPKGIKVLRLLRKLLVLPSRSLAFSEKEWPEQHPPLLESAHVLAHVPGSQYYAFVRLTKEDGRYMARLINNQ